MAYDPDATHYVGDGGPDDRRGWKGRAATWWVRHRRRAPLLATALGALVLGLVSGALISALFAGPAAADPPPPAVALIAAQPGPGGLAVCLPAGPPPPPQQMPAPQQPVPQDGAVAPAPPT